MAVISEQRREINVSKPARALRFLRITDYFVVVICGTLLLDLLVQPIVHPEVWQSGRWIFLLAGVPVLSFSVYTGYRHIGVIDARIWPAYILAFPLLFLFCVICTATTLSTFPASNSWDSRAGVQAIGLALSYLWIAVPTLWGFVAVLRLRSMRLASLGMPLVEVLSLLRSQQERQALRPTSVKKVNEPRGILIGVLGGAILVGWLLLPLPEDPQLAGAMLDGSPTVKALGFFLLMRARRYFQVNADALLAVDKRNPILFLRSFEDDEKQKFWNSEQAIVDFSLETRLANHFTNFGPFIAIGSPKERVPQLGAARVILSDSEWQSRVMGWMYKATVIIMYSGKTHWINWELAKVIEIGRVPNLIVMIPEVKGWRRSIRSQNIAARITHIREVFQNTRWREALAAIQDIQDIRAISFGDDGSLIVITSRYRNRDSYNLAVLIAHFIILNRVAAFRLNYC